MKFTELDQRMRQFETAHDHCVLPGIHIVVRLDGRNFTSLTKSSDAFEPPLSAPFDERFRGAMLVAAERCMTSGFAVVFGYTQSDEISLLLARDESSFGRKERKLCSVLAGEASAAFSLATGIHGCFDGRVCQLPQDSDVVDYFRWRAEDAHRNALSAHCYWLRRRSGEDARAADAWLRGMSTADKNEFLFQNGINYNDLPAWQKRGVGLRWERVQKAGVDPRTGEATSTERRQLRRELELPVGEAFAALISGLIAP
ncbi:MAG: tRNA(His) guanylyltransferase Thg1 family protein [Planctomycetota bacterium]